MEHFKKALELDLAQQYKGAIQEYELAILHEHSVVEAYINLAIIYWLSAAEFAWADKYKIPVEFRSTAATRYAEVLSVAKNKFPNCGELYFWERYCLHRLIFDPLEEEEVLKIISTFKECTEIPYFFLYLFDKEKYSKQRDKLLEKCQVSPTAKNIYIKSIIEN